MSNKVLFETSLTETKSTDVEGVGTLRWQDGNCYRWVQNKHSAAIAAGDVVSHSFANGTTFDQKVYDGATADLGALAGVVVSTTIAADEYGWIQVLGNQATVNVFQSQTTAWVAGASLIPVNGQLYANFGAAMGTAPVYRRTLTLLEAVATVTTGAASTFGCFIHCL